MARNNNNNNNHDHPQDRLEEVVVDATPKGYSIDVRVFIAIITTTMALAFTAGVMLGPTNPSLVNPVLNLLGVPLPMADESTLSSITGGGSAIKQTDGMNIAAPARKIAEGDESDLNNKSSSTSKKAKEIIIGPNGEVQVVGGDNNNDEEVLRQAKRTPTDHVATLGYKIKETHVNIDTPALEGSGENIPYDRDISFNNLTKEDNGEQPVLRDQSNPSGQHLLVDIKNLEAAFLNSEARLAEAMQESVKAAGLTMLSYHCHSLHPAGVSCVGVLLESHISFHTWPDEGVITLDLFTTSEKPLLPALKDIEHWFGIPRVDPENPGEMLKPVTLWSHELRGFRTEDERKAHYLDGESDLANWVTSPLEVVYKKQIITLQTEHQRIDIWDVLERDDTPSYEDGKRLGLKPGDPRWLSNEHASPTRLFFLNGSLNVSADICVACSFILSIPRCSPCTCIKLLL